MKFLRRLWWNYGDELGFFLWIIVAFIIGVMVWVCYGLYPRG